MAEYISGEKFKEMMSTNPPKRHYSGPPSLYIAAGVVLLVIGFAGGMSYQKSHQHAAVSTAVAGANGAPGSGGAGAAGSRFSGRRGTFGQVTAVSASSISVQDARSGTSVTMSITSSTQITNNGAAVAASTIQVGDTVLIRASTSDATQAAMITVNPSFGGGAGGAGAPSASSGSGSTDSTGTNSGLTN